MKFYTDDLFKKVREKRKRNVDTILSSLLQNAIQFDEGYFDPSHQ